MKRHIPKVIGFASIALIGLVTFSLAPYNRSNAPSENCISSTIRPCYDKQTGKKIIGLSPQGGRNAFQACLNSKSPSARGQLSTKTLLSQEEKYQYCSEGKSKVLVRGFLGEPVSVEPPSPPPVIITPPPPSAEDRRNGAPYDIIANPNSTYVMVHWSTEMPTLAKIEIGPTSNYGDILDLTVNDQAARFHAMTLYGPVSQEGRSIRTFHLRIVTVDPKTYKVLAYGPDETVTLYPFLFGQCKDVVRVPEEYAHIGAAIEASCEGGKVLVGPGVYREYIPDWNGASIIGAGADKTKIQSPASPSIGMDVGSLEVSTFSNSGVETFVHYVPTVSGFTISSDYVNDGKAQIFDSWGGVVTTVGLLLGGGNISTYPSGSDVGGKPLHTLGLPIVKNNVFTHNDVGIMASYQSDGVAGPGPLEIVNNTFVGGKVQDYAIITAAGDIKIDGNAITGYATGVKMWCWFWCNEINWDKLKIQYNNVFGNKTNYLFEGLVLQGKEYRYLPVLLDQAEQAGKNGNISKDPLFVNQNAGDFHEKAGSPHIDAGNPALDYSFEPEPNGGRINIGTYGNTPEAAKSK